MVISMSARVGANVVKLCTCHKDLLTAGCDYKECNMYYCVVALNLFIVFEHF